MAKLNPKRVGSEFENRIIQETHYNPRVFAWKIPHELRYINGKYIKIKGPMDFSISVDGKSVYVETKATHKDKLYLWDNVFKERKVHQLTVLLNAQDKGCKAGYMIEFIAHGKIGYISAKAIKGFYGTKKAIGPEDCVCQDAFAQIDFHKLFGFE